MLSILLFFSIFTFVIFLFGMSIYYLFFYDPFVESKQILKDDLFTLDGSWKMISHNNHLIGKKYLYFNNDEIHFYVYRFYLPDRVSKYTLEESKLSIIEENKTYQLQPLSFNHIALIDKNEEKTELMRVNTFRRIVPFFDFPGVWKISRINGKKIKNKSYHISQDQITVMKNDHTKSVSCFEWLDEKSIWVKKENRIYQVYNINDNEIILFNPLIKQIIELVKEDKTDEN